MTELCTGILAKQSNAIARALVFVYFVYFVVQLSVL